MIDLFELLKKGLPAEQQKQIFKSIIISKEDYQYAKLLERVNISNVGALDYQKFYDYGARIDGQAVYIGYVPTGIPADINKDIWIIVKNEFNASDNLISQKVAIGKWTERANYTYA